MKRKIFFYVYQGKIWTCVYPNSRGTTIATIIRSWDNENVRMIRLCNNCNTDYINTHKDNLTNGIPVSFMNLCVKCISKFDCINNDLK